MRLLIAGSRSIKDMREVAQAVVASGWWDPQEIEYVLSGGAVGVDRLGEKLAGWDGIPVKQFLPNKVRDGKNAEEIRNRQMALDCTHAVIVMDSASGTNGTKHMVQDLERAGKPHQVTVVTPAGGH